MKIYTLYLFMSSIYNRYCQYTINNFKEAVMNDVLSRCMIKRREAVHAYSYSSVEG